MRDGAAVRQAREEVFIGVRERIRATLVEHALPSLAVAVAREGEILWEEGFGWADRESRVPATEHTMYSLASISKPITTTALMILKERGKIDLDRPINEYLGGAGVIARFGDAADATVRRVANHTAGLPPHYHLFFEDEPHLLPPMGATIRRYGNLVTAPGERYEYSNLGYGVLDHVIARLSGTSYADFLRQEVFLPLGMLRSSIQIGSGLEPFAAARYGWDGRRLPFYDFDHRGASAAFCSAHDLVRFGMFHLKTPLPDQKPILTDATLDEMQTPTAEAEGTSGYGIGWIMGGDDHGCHTVGHGGGMPGVITNLLLVPSEKLVVVALANAICNLPHVVTREVLSVLLPGYAERRAQADTERSQKPPAEASPDFRPIPELIGEWQGSISTYEGEMPFRLAFQESGEVYAWLGAQMRTVLNELSYKEERLTGEMLGEIETEDARRRRHHLHVSLKLRGEVLNGTCLTVAKPGSRGGLSLSHWVELRKQGI